MYSRNPEHGERLIVLLQKDPRCLAEKPNLNVKEVVVVSSIARARARTCPEVMEMIQKERAC